MQSHPQVVHEAPDRRKAPQQHHNHRLPPSSSHETATETDCNATRPQPSDRHCVIARFPKTGGTMVKHLIEGQHHVMSLREFGQLRPAEFSADAYIIGQTRLGQTQT